MTVNECIDRANQLKDHAYDSDVVKGFCEDCDKKLYREIVEVFSDESYGTYEDRYPLSGDDEIIADDAYGILYVYYIIAQIDFFNGEIDRYTNDMIMFNTALDEYKNYYHRNHLVKNQRTRIMTD